MVRVAFALAASLVIGSARGSDAPPYGCWSIRDAVERLACFDMALGPPANAREPSQTAGEAHDPTEPDGKPNRTEAR